MLCVAFVVVKIALSSASFLLSIFSSDSLLFNTVEGRHKIMGSCDFLALAKRNYLVGKICTAILLLMLFHLSTR